MKMSIPKKIFSFLFRKSIFLSWVCLGLYYLIALLVRTNINIFSPPVSPSSSLTVQQKGQSFSHKKKPSKKSNLLQPLCQTVYQANLEQEVENDVYHPNIMLNKPVMKTDKYNCILAFYKYNNQGLLMRKKYKAGLNNYFYEYNDQGQLIKRCGDKYGNDKKLDFFTYHYNNKNQLVRLLDHNKVVKKEFEYNQKGQLAKKTDFYFWQTDQAYTITYSYQYNEKGQKIKKFYQGMATYNKKGICIKPKKNFNLLENTYEYNQKGQRIRKRERNNAVCRMYKYHE
ncbi:MAG: hypothetical protein AB3N34_01735 [Lettuce witches'-broom phytoplasma]